MMNLLTRMLGPNLMNFSPICLALVLICSSSFAYAQDVEMDKLQSAHGQTIKDISREDFESSWGEIRTCNVMFYDPEKGESTLEEGIIYQYLVNRGYQISDSGEGYFNVSQLHENFRGYVMEALTLPGEWGVYGMDIVAKLGDVRVKLFPKIRFKRKVDMENGETTMTALLKSNGVSVVTLVLREKQLSKTNYVTSVTCFIESGN